MEAEPQGPGPGYRLYTRWNIELATLLGSPVGAALLLRRNFRRLGNPRAGRRAVLAAILLVVPALSVAAVALGRGGRRSTISALVELVFLSGLFVAFERWMKDPVERHVGSGGRTGPWWHALTAAMAGLVIQVATAGPFVAVMQLHPVRRAIAEFQLKRSGGARLVFAADLERAMESRAEYLAFEIEHAPCEGRAGRAPTARVEYHGVGSEIAVDYAEASDAEHFNRCVPPAIRRQLVESARIQGGRELRLRLSPSVAAEVLDKVAKVIGRRMDGLTNDTAIIRVDGDRLIVELTERAAATLATFEQGRGGRHGLLRALLATHNLEFRIVDDVDTTLVRLGKLPPRVNLDWDRYAGQGDAIVSSPYLRSDDPTQLAEFLQDKAPQGREFRLQTIQGRQKYSRSYLLQRQGGLTGEYIVDARVAFDTSPGDQVRPYVLVTFDGTGAALFAKMTAANLKKRMAIVLDGNVDSAPIIQTAIPGGICSIHLGGLKPVNEVLQEAKDLVLTLRGGALPAVLRLVSEERIEPLP